MNIYINKNNLKNKWKIYHVLNFMLLHMDII